MKEVSQSRGTHHFVLSTIAYPVFLRQMPVDARVEGFVRQLNAKFEVIIGFLKLVPEEKVRLRVGLLSVNNPTIIEIGRSANTEPERVGSWPHRASAPLCTLQHSSMQ